MRSLLRSTILCAPVWFLAFLPAPPTQLRAADPLFVECSVDIGIDVEHDPGIGLVAGPLAMPAAMFGGGVVGDFNRDGWPDLFVVVSGGSPDRLYIADGDGTYTERSEEWGVAVTHMGLGACVGDVDGDGWPDIFVTSLGEGTLPLPGQHRLYHNVGGTGFVDIAAAAGVQTTSPDQPDGLGSTFGDIDLDGDLDLFVCSWNENALGNRLFLNDGDGVFTDVTESAGIVAEAVHGFSPRFVDMNGDRWPELLVAADFGTSQYYINDGDGTFTEYTVPSGTGLDGNGMGHTVGDFDGNGLLDWYVTSIHSLNPGNPMVPGTGNMLYMNQGNHVFDEVSESAGVKDGGWGWGTAAVDIDHDGRVDILETNGWVQPNGAGIYEWDGESSYAFRNLGDGTFADVSAASGIGAHDLQGRGLARFDFDRDGDLDLVIFANDGPVQVYRNDLTGADGNWITLRLDTRLAPQLAPDGIGAQVVVEAGGETQLGFVDSGCHYLSQSDLVVHFGLGAATLMDSLTVLWPDGSSTVMTGVPVNQELEILPPLPEFLRGDCDGDGELTLGDATHELEALFLPGGPPLACRDACDLGDDGILNLADPIALLGYLLGGGGAPPLPFPGCGFDPLPLDGLECATPPCP